MTISCQPDGRPPQPVRPWKSGRVHLAEGSNVVVLEQEIRSVELEVCPMQLFSFLRENRMIFHWDMAIYRFSKWRPSVIWELLYHHMGPPTKSLLLAAAAATFQISCQSDTQIWRYSYLNLSHIWLEMPIQAPKMGVLGDLGPLNLIIHH